MFRVDHRRGGVERFADPPGIGIAIGHIGLNAGVISFDAAIIFPDRVVIDAQAAVIDVGLVFGPADNALARLTKTGRPV